MTSRMSVFFLSSFTETRLNHANLIKKHFVQSGWLNLLQQYVSYYIICWDSPLSKQLNKLIYNVDTDQLFFCVLTMSIFSHLFTFHLLFIKEASGLWLELHLAKQDSSRGREMTLRRKSAKCLLMVCNKAEARSYAISISA